jgi:alanine-glyoxylate transaminase/serine-glyoxylate transaminase/serine-pyruvate transaminase
VAVVAAETSTGVRNDVAPLGPELAQTGTLLLVDAVTALGGTRLEIDDWQIDACYSATQKCLGAPPGIAPVTIGTRAVAKRAARTTPIHSFYLDLGLLHDFFLAAPPKYHHTASSTLAYSLHAGLGRLLEEGVEEVWERHARIGALLQSALPELGFELVAADGVRLPQLTAALLPDGLEDGPSRKRLLADYGIEVGGGLGTFAGRAWRIGLMGHSATERSVVTLLGAVRELLKA